MTLTLMFHSLFGGVGGGGKFSDKLQVSIDLSIYHFLLFYLCGPLGR